MSSDQVTSKRQIRFGEIIRSLISDCLLKEDFYYDEIQMTSITVSFVKMSKDLRIANIYFMPLGGGEFKDKLLDNLNKNKHIFQKYIAFATSSGWPTLFNTVLSDIILITSSLEIFDLLICFLILLSFLEYSY